MMYTWRVTLEARTSLFYRANSDVKEPMKEFLVACIEAYPGCVEIERCAMMECSFLLQTAESFGDVLRSMYNITSNVFIMSFFDDSVRVRVFPVSGSCEPVLEDVSGIVAYQEKEIAEPYDQREGGILDSGEQGMRGSNRENSSARDFRALTREIFRVAPKLIEDNSTKSFLLQNYLFCINDAEGLSSYLNYLLNLLLGVKLLPDRCKGEVSIFDFPSDNEEFDRQLELLLDLISRFEERGRVICLNLSPCMDRFRGNTMAEFLNKLEEYTRDSIFIFRVPFMDSATAEPILTQLRQISAIRPVFFPPMSVEELYKYALITIRRRGYTLEESVFPVFEKRILQEKKDGRFFGTESVDKILDEMIYDNLRSQRDSGKEDKHIRGDQISRVANEDIELHLRSVEEKHVQDERISPVAKKDSELISETMATLRSMIGMEDVCRQVEEIVAQIQLTRKSKMFGSPCMHMRFIGSPGTGKTTVARLLGRIMRERKLLRRGEFFECSGRDLCGRYVGETAPKTRNKCKDAYGSLLFIDEAYALYQDGSDRDYGPEVITTLMSEMENHRSDLVVIMAGYKDDMENLMRSNSGLQGRMPYEIVFPNYSREDLIKIYFLFCHELITYNLEFRKAVEQFFLSIPDSSLESKDFDNARFVRNLFERTCAKAAVRINGDFDETLELTAEDFQLASKESIFTKILKGKQKIGFTV